MGGALEKPQNYWQTFNLTSYETVLKLLKELNATNHQIPSGNIIKFKFVVEKNFEELRRKHLKTLEQKCKFKSIVILVAANDGKEFHIYWKSKDIDKFLTFKSFDDKSYKNDKNLFEYAAEYLVKSLKNGNLVTDTDFDIIANNYQLELQHKIDTRNFSLQLKKNELISPILTQQNFNSGVTLKHLQENNPYPSNLDISRCSEDVKEFISMCEDVHISIKTRNLTKLNEILSKNPNLKYFYNLQNESALKTAVTCGSLRIYRSLIERNYGFAPHENAEEIFKPLNLTDKEDLSKIHIDCRKDLPEKHINILMHNSSVTHDETDKESKMELVRRAYSILNKDSRLSIILQIVAAVKQFHILFDFQRDSTFVTDPTTNKNTTGIFYFNGKILIAAKQFLNPKLEHEAFGALAHELCHFAVFEVFENKSNPFRKSDLEAEKKFKKILDICKLNKNKDSVIRNVYDCNHLTVQPSELVVRPAHLIAMYYNQPLILNQKMLLYPELFDYFETVIIPAMKIALPKIDAKLAYKPAYTFNDLSEQRQNEIKNAIVMYKSVKVKLSELYPDNSSVFDKLHPEHISQLLDKKVLNFNDPYLRYLEDLIVFKWQKLARTLRERILDSKLKFQGRIISFRDLQESCPNSFNFLTSMQIINILSRQEMNVGDEVKPENQFYVERKFIPEDAKLIDFEYQYGSKYVDKYETREQHKKQRIKNITLETFSREFMKKNFNEILEILNEAKANPHLMNCYFDLCQKGYGFMHKSSTEIITQAKSEKILILSSDAGAGKTLTFEQLAIESKKICPNQWVSYIDLNSFTKHYKAKGTIINVEALLEKILNLDTSKNAFEAEVFRESFRSGNAVLVWNGFDEISPTYNSYILTVIKSIRNLTSNVQFVCTRPLYSSQLSQAFQVRTWQLLPFDELKKQEFLKDYFVFKEVPVGKIETNIERVENIVNKLNYEKLSFAYDFNSPLMLKLIAEIHKNEMLFENAYIYGVFEAFVDAKIQLWLQKCRNSFDAASRFFFDGSLIKFFQKYALLNELRIFSSTNLALKIRKLQIMQRDFLNEFKVEDITRLGILYINGRSEFQFGHKTLSEFFVAQYFIENIFNNNYISSDEAELILELFFHLTKTYGNLQQIITDFMGSFLQMKDHKRNNTFNPTILHLLKTKFSNLFIRMLDTNHPKVFEFLFKFFNKDHNVLVELLQVHKDETFYTAIFNPNYFGLSTNPDTIKHLAAKCLNDDEYDKFLHGRNQKGKIMLGMHFYRMLEIVKSHESYDLEVRSLKGATYWNVFNKYFEPPKRGFIMKLLGRTEDKRLTEIEQQEVLMTALSPKIYLFYNKLFSGSDFAAYEKIWESYEKLLPVNKIPDFFGDILVQYFELCAYEFKGHKQFLSLILEKIKKFMTKFQIYELFLNKSILHGAHWSPNCLNELWEFLKTHTTKEERKNILYKDEIGDKSFYFYTSRNEIKNKHSHNEYSYMYYDLTQFKLFHRAIITNFIFTKEIYEDHFDQNEIKTIILSSSDFLYYAIRTINEKPCKDLAAWLQKLFPQNDNLLNQKVKQTNLTVKEFIELFRGLPHSQTKWFTNLDILERGHS